MQRDNSQIKLSLDRIFSYHMGFLDAVTAGINVG